MLFLCAFEAFSAPNVVKIAGIITDKQTGEPVAGAVVNLDALWCISSADGKFLLEGVQKGRYDLKVQILGYVDYVRQITVNSDLPGLTIKMDQSSLALDEVVVTAGLQTGTSGTTRTVGREALDHLQINNVADIADLMPGGKTSNPDLTASSPISIRQGGSSAGNAAFGTAVEVDGVRMGNNASFGELAGIDTRSISVDNIDRVEVVSGVASAEYGDLGSGMVRIHTKTGRTPFNISFSVNPRTYQVSAAKGVGLGEGRGVLNLSAEWARAVKKPVSPYESYTRRSINLKYSNTFNEILYFEAGVTGNVGGMNTKDDPDAVKGEYSSARNNVVRANTTLNLMLNRNWITNLKFEASANYDDARTSAHLYSSSASSQPAVHSEYEGYYLATALPLSYFSDKVVDSRELDFAASLKYIWIRRFGSVKNNLKAGVQWKANGNAGEGEYYENPALEANGYRPRPYSQYPFMHNVSAYAEDVVTFPFGLEISAGLRYENVYVKGTRYNNVNSLSPRLNAKYEAGKHITLRAGWGIAEKLPSFFVLYPKQEYRDIQTFGVSVADRSLYTYYTQPYRMVFNPSLKWQRNNNTEIGIDGKFKNFAFSVAGFLNITNNPYKYTTLYTPFSYNVGKVADGYTVPANPEIKIDNQTGVIYMRDDSETVWSRMDTKVTDRSFAKSIMQDNGAPVTRAGVELTLDFPEIKAIRTKFKLDGSYIYTDSNDKSLSYFYNAGWSHTSLSNRSYQYVGIYENGGNSTSVICGKVTHNLDANLTAITHIPEARLIITCRLEVSLLTRSLNFPAGDKDRLLPVAYMDLDGKINPFGEAEASNPEFANLILYPSNDFTFVPDGYGSYASANISITKEIGKHVSLSFFANNFTNSRPYVVSKATGVGAVFTPDFYYGLTCRIKL